MLNNTRMFRTVTSSVKAYKDDKPIDIRLMREQERQKAAMEATRIYNENCLKQVEEDEKRKVASEAFNHINNLTRLKSLAYNAVEKDIPDLIVSEAFARIYIDALPHDRDFVIENYNGLKNMASFYIKKLGGANYLKQRVYETHNPFLSKLYDVCMETAKPIKAKKKEKIAASLSEEEVKEMIVPKINDEERETIIKNINNLGTEELSELVREKIINVVKDEHQREKEEREFRTVLKNDISDPNLRMVADNPSKIDKKGGSIETGDDEMLDDVEPVNGTEPGKTDKNPPPKKTEAPKKEETKSEVKKDEKEDKPSGTKPLISSKEDEKKDEKPAKESSMYLDLDFAAAMERWDPIKQNFNYSEGKRPRDLFFSICTSVTRDLMNQKLAYENAGMNITKKVATESLLRNPLNLDIFTSYIKSNDIAIDAIVDAEYTEPGIYASTDPGIIDKDRILTESLIQYGLLEAAYTMKLIDPTQQQIKEQCDYLLKD